MEEKYDFNIEKADKAIKYVKDRLKKSGNKLDRYDILALYIMKNKNSGEDYTTESQQYFLYNLARLCTNNDERVAAELDALKQLRVLKMDRFAERLNGRVVELMSVIVSSAIVQDDAVSHVNLIEKIWELGRGGNSIIIDSPELVNPPLQLHGEARFFELMHDLINWIKWLVSLPQKLTGLANFSSRQADTGLIESTQSLVRWRDKDIELKGYYEELSTFCAGTHAFFGQLPDDNMRHELVQIIRAVVKAYVDLTREMWKEKEEQKKTKTVSLSSQTTSSHERNLRPATVTDEGLTMVRATVSSLPSDLAKALKQEMQARVVSLRQIFLDQKLKNAELLYVRALIKGDKPIQPSLVAKDIIYLEKLISTIREKHQLPGAEFSYQILNYSQLTAINKYLRGNPSSEEVKGIIEESLKELLPIMPVEKNQADVTTSSDTTHQRRISEERESKPTDLPLSSSK